MNQETATPESLADFLLELRAGRAPAAPLECGRASASFHTDACPATMAAALARLANRPLPGLTLYKFGSRSIVGSHTLQDGRRVVLKYYYPSNPAKHLAYGIRGSRCRQSWLGGLAFGFIGVPTPAPLVIAEWQRFGGLWLSKSFLATRPAEGVALNNFIGSHGPEHPLLAQAAASLRRSFDLMARHRAVHGDLKANNLLLSESGEVSFIDLDASCFLLPEADFRARREKDRRRFVANWKDDPAAARLFQDVFKSP
jgi:tRNA A-37 threonylcarbamoyl transferase component Bud32